jgi:hypothetical protein
VRLVLGETVLTQSFEVLPDPRVDVSSAALREQFNLLIEIRDRLSRTHDAANRITALRSPLAQWSRRPDVAPLLDAIEHLDAALVDVDQSLIQRAPGLSYAHPIQLNAKLAALAAVVGSADAEPTRASREVLDDLSRRLDGLLERLDQLVSVDLAQLNASLRDLQVPPVASP